MVWSVCHHVHSNYHDGHDMSKIPGNHQKGRDGGMKRTILISIPLLALVGSKVGVPAARSETPSSPASASGTYNRPASFNVKDFGAKGDGVADDAPAVQSAINAATKSTGGGTVIFPKGTYLLNSAYPSRHPWAFHNLLIESNVTLVGETGAKLLQGPKGRHPLPERAEGVRNSVLAFGADHETIRFQNRGVTAASSLSRPPRLRAQRSRSRLPPIRRSFSRETTSRST
jgi:hypothetical protein